MLADIVRYELFNRLYEKLIDRDPQTSDKRFIAVSLTFGDSEINAEISKR